MKRIGRLVVVALVVAAMALALAMPAFAAKPTGFILVCSRPLEPNALILEGTSVTALYAQATGAGYTRNECNLSVATTSP